MLEKMGEFFDRRLEGYEEHQLTAIAAAGEFYPFTAACLPKKEGARVLDLGCGTGLELSYYFEITPTAQLTCIDLAPGMLAALQKKFAERKVQVIQGSYFDLPLGENRYDAAVSVESLHHFTKAQKIPLYQKLVRALTEKGYFVLTDYFAADDEEEAALRRQLEQLKKEQGIADDAFYHFDTPLTVEHEMEALRQAGFSNVKLLSRWEGATRTICAEK